MKEKPLPNEDTEHEFTDDAAGDLLSGVIGYILGEVGDLGDLASGGLQLHKR